jgi:hypothetical protein
MVAARRSPLQFGLRFLFLLLAVSAVLSAALAVAVEEPALMFLLGLAGTAAGLICIGRSIPGPLDQAADAIHDGRLLGLGVFVSTASGRVARAV